MAGSTPREAPAATHDHHGFAELYAKFGPIYAAEEEERSAKWDAFLADLRALVGSVAGEDDAALLQRALGHLGGGGRSGEALAQASALLQRLSSLVQTGLPMAKRGAFWQLFLDVQGRRREGEYRRLVGEVEELERRCACPSPASAPRPPFPAPPKPPACPSPSAPYNLVADASRAGAAWATAHRVDVFSITPLDAESPEGTPAKPAGGGGAKTPGADAPAGATAAEAAEAAAAAVTTPASTLFTPQASSTASSADASSGAAGGTSDASSSPSSSLSRTAERWRQQDFLAQIDKDLHRTFPGTPHMDEAGRATLRRILAAYARRNPAGLNFLAATLMLFMPEEAAFWCLCAVIEDVLGSSYFDERMVLPQVDVLVFGHLLQGRFPTLWRHFQALEVDAASVTMSWFLCCFLNALPLDSALRVWDLLFFEGGAVVLFRVALALVEIYEQALMCSRESSDAYQLLQVCPAMTYDSSHLVDTACCGYSHLQPAGLQVLRQRYRPSVLANLRSSFPSDDEYDAYVQRSLQGSPASGRGGAAPFADAFKRVSSALTEAAEEEQREQLRQQGSPADSGHLSLPSSRSRGSSRRSSPGGGGSQPASPLARMRHAVSGLTSRLMPSSLPQLLPSGAVDASGQELPVSGTGPARLGTLGARLPAGAARRASCSAAESSAAAGGLEQQGSGAAAGAVRPQRILVSGAGIDSPTSGMTGSAGSGAVLGRRAPALTPFSEMESLQWQQQEGAAAGSCTPQRLAGLPPWGAQAVVAQSQPATPSDMLLAPQPPATHRRAMTAGYSAASTASRRRRRVHLDLLQPLAGLRPIDLQRPAVAAALAIAANPSPRATISPGTGGARDGKGLRSSDGVAAAACASGGGLGAAGSPSGSVGSAEELVLPIRALQFDAEDGAAGQAGSGGVRRASTAPPAAWLAAALAGEASVESVEAELPVSSSALRPWGTSSDDGAPAADGGAGACGRPVDLQQQQSAAPAAIADTATPSGSTTASPSGLGAASLPGRPLSASPCGPGGSQSRRALLAVVSQLQEEVAVAESRRHEAERQAQEAADLAADLRRQLLKVQGLVASKEALIAEMSEKLGASGCALTELEGELAAARMAVEAEEQAAERRRRQLGSADALLRRLMSAVAQQKGARSGTPAAAAVQSSASSGEATSGSYYSAAASPQSSSGSAGPSGSL